MAGRGVTVATWTFAIALAVYAFDQGGATAVGIAGPCAADAGGAGLAVCRPARR